MIGILTFRVGAPPFQPPEISGYATDGLEKGLTSLMGPYPRSGPIFTEISLRHNWYFRVPGFPNT